MLLKRSIWIFSVALEDRVGFGRAEWTRQDGKLDVASWDAISSFLGSWTFLGPLRLFIEYFWMNIGRLAGVGDRSGPRNGRRLLVNWT
jgi:hypothetical protein